MPAETAAAFGQIFADYEILQPFKQLGRETYMLSPEEAQTSVLTRFASHVRRHLAAENAILLPIARARLTRRDLQNLSRQMRARRGLPPVAETPDAD